MDRAEAEKKIFEKLREIKEISEAYNPNQRLMSLSINNGHVSFFNEYWEGGNDFEMPLDFWKDMNQEDE